MKIFSEIRHPLLQVCLVVIFLFVSTSQSVLSQSAFQGFLGVGISAGASNYKGDLDDNFTLKFTRYGIGGHFVFMFSPHWNIRATIYNGEVTASDALGLISGNKARNLSFRSPITEVGVQLVYRLLGSKTGELARRNITPYFFVGIAVFFHFNPQDSINGNWIDLQPIGTEGQYLSGGNYPKPYSLTQVAIPFGMGLTKKLNKNFDLGIEVGMRKTFTDYLDDVSGTYPDEAQLLEQEGKLAVDLSDRAINRHIVKGGPRGDPNAKDWYTYTNINITYYFTWNSSGSEYGHGKHTKSNCNAFPESKH